ncbi:MAG: serine/threonine protein kinase [Planctomycetes bacterium]|nr:serine/threonine protein kinase [Planctomycetota bacterium]
MTDPDAATVRAEPPRDDRIGELLAEYLLAAEIGPRPELQEFLARLTGPADRERFVELLDQVAFAGRHLPLRLRPELVLADRYELIEPIGSGGMGQVWRAHDRTLDLHVAVKVLSVAAAAAVDLDRLVQREGKLLAKLSHPGVVRVLDIGHDEEHRFLVMELVPGVSLDGALDLLRERRRVLGRGLTAADVLALTGPPAPGRAAVLQGREPWAQTAAKVMIELLRTLEATHGTGVVHRDLKPGNVRWSGGGYPVLLDFGISLRADQEPGTRTSELFGTAVYAAPEQWRSAGEVGMHTDVYQAGLVLYELLTLERCFASSSPIETMRAVREARYRRPRELDPGIDPRLEACVLRAIEVEPTRRYASAAAFRDDLERYLAGEVPAAANASAKWSWHARAFVRRRRRPLALAAAALLGAAALWLAGGREPVAVRWVGDRTLTVEVAGAGRLAGFLAAIDANGDTWCAPLKFGDQLVRDVDAGEVRLELGPEVERYRQVVASTFFAASGDPASQRELADVVPRLEQAQRSIDRHDGEWLPAPELKARFAAGRGTAASTLPVERLFVEGAWSANGMQVTVAARSPSSS